MEGSLVQVRTFGDTRNFSARLKGRLHYWLYFVDIGVIALSAALAYALLDMASSPQSLVEYALLVAIAIAAFSFFAFNSGVYDWRQFRQHLNRPTATFGAILFAFGCLLIIGFTFKITGHFSRLWTGSWFSSVITYLLVSRLALAWYLNQPTQRALMSRQALILGAGESGQEVLDHILRFDGQGIEVVGFLDDRASRLPKSYRGVPVLGRTDRLEQLLHGKGPDLIIMALPRSAVDRIQCLIKKLSQWSVDIYIAPDKLGLIYADRPVFRLGGMSVRSLKDRPISEWSAVVKRIEDLCIAVPAVILLSPLLALIALAIRLESKGGALFVQKRYGFNNNLIPVYKFRSMYTDMTDVNAERLATKDDPRITRVGRFIRKTSIDELPQLFNVIQGDMSIVGPRPHATRAKAGDQLYQEVVDQYASRHRVKPGITGWAQCNGWRGETDTREKIEKRVEHDLYYIENWSVFLDLLTILKTLMLLIKKDVNAY
ncbi:undecaprenyl-phosphate glucose phosphotransferase [Thiorhodococcus fuscus]|uniref:Undecaprenyl-phosphate glucose phosphotransferase n=1 Tax=Thiorhodococcus fuscus TaxID=527200 RepID=A0ABW4YBZ3_9GAMM